MHERKMKHDDIPARIEAFDDANGGGVGYYEDNGAYHLYLLETEAPIGLCNLSSGNSLLA